MKQNMSLGMNLYSGVPHGVPKYSQKYKDVLERAYKRDQSLKVKPKLFFYRIRSIGVGAHSLVYQVSQQNSGTLFAQKAICKKTIQPELATQIKLHLSLNHSNIVNLYHIYSEQEYVKMIMDYGGQSLFTQRKKNKLPTIMNQQLIVSILKQLIAAVAYLHNKKIVHADIKLQNILYLDGVVKLCDFGYAHIAKDEQSQYQKHNSYKDHDYNYQRKMNEMERKYKQKQMQKQRQGINIYQTNYNYKNTSKGSDKHHYTFQNDQKNKENRPAVEAIVGTLQYLDPEYVQGKHSQFSRDIWAIGIVAYELCTGKHPFQGMAQNQKWSMILKIKQINLSNLSSSISRNMVKLLQCTLCPIQRRASITQIQMLQLFNHDQYQKKVIQAGELAFIS